MSLAEAKAALRVVAKFNRRVVAADAGPEASVRLAANLTEQFKNFSGQVVSGYIAIADEIDVIPSLRLLEKCGLKAALPVVIGQDLPLTFRFWTSEMDLTPGPLQTKHPPIDSPKLVPDIVIVPMLAFDTDGYRIGWGGGYFDRTLEKIRSYKPVIAVGAAFLGQQVDKVPRDHHDARLDWIATETGLIEIVANH